MSLRDRFRAFLHPDLLADRHATVILERLQKIEDDALRHEIVMRETADQVARHLKRVAAIEHRQGEREERGINGMSDVTRRILEMKLGGGNR